jgi:hypothetical protein
MIGKELRAKRPEDLGLTRLTAIGRSGSMIVVTFIILQ